MRNKELIKTADSLCIGHDYFSLYNFMLDYLTNMKINNNTGVNGFFRAIKIIENSCYNQRITNSNLRHALGKTGNNMGYTVTKWCRQIESCKALEDLTLDELHYVMGCAARMCKADDKKNKQESFWEQYSTDKKEPEKPRKTVKQADINWKCKRCGAELVLDDSKKSMAGKGWLTIKCAACGFKNKI